jgi:hypothetical protein
MSILIHFPDENSEFMWGLLIATWTKGEPPPQLSHIDPEKLKVPASLADLRAQIELVGIKVTIPDSYTGLTVVREGPQNLVVRLPEKSQLIMAEKALREGSVRYILPHFYATFLGPLRSDTPEDMLKLQTFRIGDYAIATCM